MTVVSVWDYFKINSDEIDKFHKLLMNVYVLNFLIDQNKTKSKKVLGEKKTSKTQKKKQRIQKRLKLKQAKASADSNKEVKK